MGGDGGVCDRSWAWSFGAELWRGLGALGGARQGEGHGGGRVRGSWGQHAAAGLLPWGRAAPEGQS